MTRACEVIEFPVESEEEAIKLFKRIVHNTEDIGFDDPWNPEEGASYADDYDGHYQGFSLETIHEVYDDAIWGAIFYEDGYNEAKRADGPALHIRTFDRVNASTTEDVARRINDVVDAPYVYETFRSCPFH
jgi:hypothetical protein